MPKGKKNHDAENSKVEATKVEVVKAEAIEAEPSQKYNDKHPPKKLKRKAYEEELRKLQVELVKLQYPKRLPR